MPGEVEFDMGAALDDMSTGLGFEPPTEGDDGDKGEVLDGLVTEGQEKGAEENPTGVTGDNPAGDPAKPEAAQAKPDATSPATPAPGPDDPPRTWRKEAQAEWATLSPTIKAEIRKREEDAFQGIEGYKEAANFGNSVRDVLRPYMPILQQHNIDPRQQIQGLMNSHYTLAFGAPEAKVALIQQILKDYKIDPATLGLGGEPAYVDPAVQSLQEKIQALESASTQERAARAAAERAELQRTVDNFLSAKDKYPYAEELINDMIPLLNSRVCNTLEEAYDKALWGNPAVRAKEQARVQAEADAKRQAEESARREKLAKASRVNVRSSPRSGSAAAPLGSMDDTLNETLRTIQARG